MLKELISRFKAPTPLFFKKLQKLGASLIALSSALMVIPKIPQAATPLLTNIAVIGGVIAAVSQFAKDNTNEEIK